MSNSRKLLYGVALLFAVAVSIYVTRWWYETKSPQRVEESQLLLEQVKNVAKLVTVEGYFSEIYSEKDTKDYYLFSSTKKALIKVKAKVSAGYDLSNMKVEADVKTKTLHISNIPQPTIISIEPEISYYDVENGYFNSFTTEDITRLNKKAIDTIRTQALQSSFMQNVSNQGAKNFDALTALAKSMGWSVVFDGHMNLPFKQ
jgi:hypothetical protein